MFKAFKRWRLNRKLRQLRVDLDFMENYTARTTAAGCSPAMTVPPDWIPAGIAAAKVRIGLVEQELAALR